MWSLNLVMLCFVMFVSLRFGEEIANHRGDFQEARRLMLLCFQRHDLWMVANIQYNQEQVEAERRRRIMASTCEVSDETIGITMLLSYIRTQSLHSVDSDSSEDVPLKIVAEDSE